MRPEYERTCSLGLRKLFKEHDMATIAGDPSRHCSIWFVIDKERFFAWTERRKDIYQYHYVVEVCHTEIGSCLRIHAVERSRKL